MNETLIFAFLSLIHLDIWKERAEKGVLQLCVKCVGTLGAVTTFMNLYFGASQQSYSSLLCNKRQENEKSCEKRNEEKYNFVNYIPISIKNEILSTSINIILSFLQQTSAKKQTNNQTANNKEK